MLCIVLFFVTQIEKLTHMAVFFFFFYLNVDGSFQGKSEAWWREE